MVWWNGVPYVARYGDRSTRPEIARGPLASVLDYPTTAERLRGLGAIGVEPLTSYVKTCIIVNMYRYIVSTIDFHA